MRPVLDTEWADAEALAALDASDEDMSAVFDTGSKTVDELLYEAATHPAHPKHHIAAALYSNRYLDAYGDGGGLVDDELRKLEARTEAKRRLAERDYQGTRPMSWDDLESRKVEWFVEDLVQKGGIVFLMAPKNTGKTFFLVDMVCRMALGMDFLGKATQPAKTLFVVGEGSYGLIGRFTAWCAENGRSLEEVKPWIEFVDGANLNVDMSVGILREHAADKDLIIFDTYATTAGLADENDSALASFVMNRAAEINPTATVLFTHHPRKSDDTTSPVMRGSGAIDGRADAVLSLMKEPKRKVLGHEGIKWMLLSTEAEKGGKMRNAKTQTIHGLYLKDGDESGVLGHLDDSSVTKNDELVLEHLTSEMTAEDFSNAVLASGGELSKGHASRVLVNSPYAVCVQEHVGRRPARFSPKEASE